MPDKQATVIPERIDAMSALAAAVLDLDGVVTLTARIHFAAWKQLFDGFFGASPGRTGDARRPFSEHDYRAFVDGLPRYEGVRTFLASRGISLNDGEPSDPPERETVCGLGNRKNALFHALLERDGVDVDESTIALVRDLRARGVPVAVASSSKNCGLILRKAGLEHLFDATVDGVVSARLGLRGKPNPDVFLDALHRLGVSDVARAVLVEDAAAGVAAGRAGGFGLVIGIDRGSNRAALRASGADWVVESLKEVSGERIDRFLAGRAELRPNALYAWDELRARLTAARPAVFLDYDGTLTPIVARPELALLAEDMRDGLRALARAWPTCVVSGRGLDDVRRLVGLETLVYAGSHGFDIAGPNGLRLEVDPEIVPTVERAAAELARRVRGIPGSLVEDKRFSVAVHFREVSPERVGEIESIVDAVLEAHPALRKSHGKKVFELRPVRAWDKGRALVWLLEALHLDDERTVPVYVGDDTTDEDAFRAIAGRGIGILVADLPRNTAAGWSLQDTSEVGELLRRLADLREGRRE